MIEIPLTGKHAGAIALIDDEDLPKVIGRAWNGHQNSTKTMLYARCGHLFLHHVVLDVKVDPEHPVEHLDHNGLNCQKYNLLVSSHARNKLNRFDIAQRNRIDSKHCGVGFDQRTGKWTAHIGANYYWYGLGAYATEEEAHKKVAETRELLLATPIEEWDARMIKYKRHGGRERLTESELRDKYETQRMSLKQIAYEFGTTAPTINRWLREYGIARRVPGKRTWQAVYGAV